MRSKQVSFLFACRTVGATVLAATVLLALLGTPASEPSLVRGPYLQLLATDGVTIVWQTDVAAACGLEIGPVGGSRTVLTGVAGTECTMDVDGLTAGTAYTYRPLADGVGLRGDSTFTTDEPTLPFTFLVFGDSGSGNAKQADVRDALRATRADFILHTGDVVYEDGAAADYDPKLFMPYRDLLRRLVLWPCLGSHDVRTDDGDPWRAAFHTPANNALGAEDYYSFDFGNAHLVVLDSTGDLSPGSAQHAFLDADLAASTGTWNFVAFHHSIYSSRRSFPDLKAALVPVFDRHGVDMVFMGHDHFYERTLALAGDAVVAPGTGTVYVTTGGGGKSLRAIRSSGTTAYAEVAFHFTRVTVGGEWLLAQMVREDGAIRDALVLEKGASPPPVTCGDELVNQPSEECDGADDVACPAGCGAGCTCLPYCGDGIVNDAPEECDADDDGACPGVCRVDCRCGDPARVVEVVPVADTYIEAGREAARAHGDADHLDVDDVPVAIAYLTFDLGAAPGRVSAATLILHATNGSPDGGTVYPVADSSWIEGDGSGSGTPKDPRPGLTFIDVDTNGDGEISARDTSPWVPLFDRWTGTMGIIDAGRRHRVDVTAAVQDGPGVYSFAVANNASDQVTYTSREHPVKAQRPVLRLEYYVACDTVGDCDDRIACTADACQDGACVHAPDDGTCDDGVFCNGAERCGAGSGCRIGADPCDDGVACTVDVCDEAAASCDHLEDDASCADGNPCNGNERCDAAVGCRAGAPVDGLRCDDGNPCTDGDTCAAGACSGTPRCGNGVIDVACGETCDGAAGGCVRGCIPPGAAAACTCVPAGRCGDESVNQPSEDCDGADDAVCPAACGADCRCRAVGVVEADVGVRETDPGQAFGDGPEMWVDASAPKQTFLRIRVSGVRGRRVASAHLALQVATASAAASDSGGRIHAIGDCVWDELVTTWVSRPVIDGSVIDDQGPVAPGDRVTFDLTTAVAADGVYCVAIDSISSDGTTYYSREAAGGRPEVTLELDTPCGRDADCDDADPCTADACDVGTGACRAIPTVDGTACAGGVCCQGVCRVSTCTVDADCDDGEACTAEACVDAGICTATCSYLWAACGAADGCCGPACDVADDSDCRTSVCGDGLCAGAAAGENCFTCRADCRCQGKDCTQACCGDGVCTGSENARTCAADCG